LGEDGNLFCIVNTFYMCGLSIRFRLLDHVLLTLNDYENIVLKENCKIQGQG